MVAPRREPARNNQQTYFVTFTTAGRTPFFRHERWLLLLLNLLERHAAAFLLHDYVVMPDHVHLLLTPVGALERSAQLVKGGFSYQAKRQFAWAGRIWQDGFHDHRIRDARDYDGHVRYIAANVRTLPEPLRTQRGRHGGLTDLVLHAAPPRLKPLVPVGVGVGGTEVPPCQSEGVIGGDEAPPRLKPLAPLGVGVGGTEVPPCQSSVVIGGVEVPPSQGAVVSGGHEVPPRLKPLAPVGVVVGGTEVPPCQSSVVIGGVEVPPSQGAVVSGGDEVPPRRKPLVPVGVVVGGTEVPPCQSSVVIGREEVPPSQGAVWVGGDEVPPRLKPLAPLGVGVGGTEVPPCQSEGVIGGTEVPPCQNRAHLQNIVEGNY